MVFPQPDTVWLLCFLLIMSLQLLLKGGATFWNINKLPPVCGSPVWKSNIILNEALVYRCIDSIYKAGFGDVIVVYIEIQEAKT